MKPNRTLALFSCYAAMTTLAIACNLMPVCLPLIKGGFGQGPLTNEELGRVVAATFIGLVSGILITGPLANRYHARYFAVGGNLIIAVGLACLGVARTYDELLLSVGLMGFGAGALDMILSPIVCAIQPENRTQALNWLHSFFCVGAVLTILLATVALTWMSWREVALLMVIFPLIVGSILTYVHLPNILHESNQRTKVRHLFLHPFFLIVIGGIFLGGAAEAGLAQWLPAFAELELKTPRWVGGTAFLSFSVAMALGRMVVGQLGRRLPVYRLLGWSCALTTGLFLIAGLCPIAWIALGASVLAGFTGSCLWPSILGIAGDRYPLAGASMFGILAAVGNFGGIVMPWGVGLIADTHSIGVGLAATALCPFLLGGLIWQMRERASVLVPAVPAAS
jgi:fucose permease